MSDRRRIIAGLAAFLVILAFPLWQTLGASAERARPELELPVDESSCIESTEYMRAYHMDLLNRWRTAVVRAGEGEYTATTGEAYEMSLTGTCMGCHDNRETFCTRCHDYANVAPRCWNCHVEPEGS